MKTGLLSICQRAALFFVLGASLQCSDDDEHPPSIDPGTPEAGSNQPNPGGVVVFEPTPTPGDDDAANGVGAASGTGGGANEPGDGFGGTNGVVDGGIAGNGGLAGNGGFAGATVIPPGGVVDDDAFDNSGIGGADSNPFGSPAGASSNPFGGAGGTSSNPFGGAGGTSSNPFGGAGGTSSNPFAAGAGGNLFVPSGVGGTPLGSQIDTFGGRGFERF